MHILHPSAQLPALTEGRTYNISQLSCLFKINRINNFVINIILLTIPIHTLPTMSTIMKEQTILRLSPLHKPLHRPSHILFGRSTRRILRIIRQNNNIPLFESISLDNEMFDVENIVDTSPQLILCANVIYSDEKGFSMTCTLRILELVLWKLLVEVLTVGGNWHRTSCLSIWTILVCEFLRGG